MNTRRHFLQTGAALLGAWSLPSLATASSPRPDGRLILIFLRGGMDGLFALSPSADPRFETLRPTLAQSVLTQGLPLTGTGFSAHPSAAALARLFDEKHLAFAPCCGTTDRSRSHFQAQDIFELGSGAIRGTTGLLARSADWLGKQRTSISFTSNVPLIFQGARQQPGIAPLSGSGLELAQDRVLAAIRAMHRDQPSGEAIDKALSTGAEIEAALPSGMDPKAARGAPGIAGFPKVAGLMARILRENPHMAVSFIDLGGFDTHANQEANLSRSLTALGDSLLALRDGLGDQEWARTQVLVCSEFGRTVRENGSQGTDHGHGGLALLLGGNIDGGRMIGDFPGLADAELNEGRDLKTLVDWRSLIGRALRDTQGMDQATLQKILPGLPGLG